MPKLILVIGNKAYSSWSLRPWLLMQQVGIAFEEIRLHRLEAACMPANAASLRTLERGGFTREGLARRYLKINGVWEDHVLFGLPREDWSQARSP